MRLFGKECELEKVNIESLEVGSGEMLMRGWSVQYALRLP